MANKLNLYFVTDAGKKFTLSINNPCEKSEVTVDNIKTAMTAIVAQQPFTVTLASAKNAEYIETVKTPYELD